MAQGVRRGINWQASKLGVMFNNSFNGTDGQPFVGCLVIVRADIYKEGRVIVNAPRKVLAQPMEGARGQINCADFFAFANNG